MTKAVKHAGQIGEGELISILQSGIMAPSADNHHYVMFEMRPDHLRMWAAREFLDCNDNHRLILARVSFGCVIENMVLTANSMGYELEVDWNPDTHRPALLANMRFSPFSKPARNEIDILAEMIPLRHTNRRYFRKQRLTKDCMSLLQSEVLAQAGVDLVWLEGENRAKALRLVRLAEAERFRRPFLHNDLFSAVRFDVGWRSSCNLGLPPGSLEVEPGLRLMFRTLKYWPLMRAMNYLGAYHLLGFRAGYLPCKMAPHLGVIVTRGNLERDAIPVGRSFQRLWLRATAMGVALQPMAASIILPFQDPRSDGVSTALRNLLTTGWRELLGDANPAMCFRMGYASAPHIKSGRRTVEEHLVRSEEFRTSPFTITVTTPGTTGPVVTMKTLASKLAAKSPNT